MIRILKKIVDFSMPSSEGDITLPYKNVFTVIYYCGGCFLPSVASDILALDKAVCKFEACGAKVCAVTPDSQGSNIAWLMSLKNHKRENENILIPLASDHMRKFARYCDITDSEKVTMIIDENGMLRALHRHSHNIGINVTELERELLSVKAAKTTAQTPAGWVPGAELMSFAPTTLKDALENVESSSKEGRRAVDWYISYLPNK